MDAKVIAILMGAALLLITALFLIVPSLFGRLASFIAKSTPETSERDGPHTPTDGHW
jgi:hypothetical protein